MADDTSTTGQQRFRGVLTLEGVRTSDKRQIEPNESTWRELPITMMAITKASHGGNDNETEYAGAIDLVERQPGTAPGTFQLYYEGFFDTGDVGTETARLVGAKVVRGVSIDFAIDRVEFEVLEEDEDGWPTDWTEHFFGVEILGATVCPFPAFEGGTIELVDGMSEEPAPADDVPVDEAASAILDLPAAAKLPALVASACEPCADSRAGALVAAGGPVKPPADWFRDPQFDGPTAWTVDDDGRCYGHLALWNTCHVGQMGQCIVPPHSATNYSQFLVAATHTAEGTRVATAALVMGTGHADTHRRLSISEVQAHYDNTGAATADVAAGEDRWGIWVAGAMRPDLTDGQIRAARGSVLSGDWRPHGTGLELTAALHVNVGGFTVERARMVSEHGQPLALVAAGAMASARLAEVQRAGAGASTDDIRAVLRQELAPLLEPLAAATREAARAKIGGALNGGTFHLHPAVEATRTELASRAAEALRAQARAQVGR